MNENNSCFSTTTIRSNGCLWQCIDILSVLFHYVDKIASKVSIPCVESYLNQKIGQILIISEKSLIICSKNFRYKGSYRANSQVSFSF